MRIIHCADLHLDSKMESNLPKEKAEERKQELLHTFARMVAYAEENEVSVIIIAGDLFDTASTQQIRIKNQIEYEITQHPNIDFVYLRGNHDKDDYFASMENKPDNLKCFGNTWSQFKYGPIAITGRELPDTMTDGIYSELILNPDEVNIVVMHGQTANSDGKDDAPLINLKKLMNKNIDYLALGHIHSHRYEKLDVRGTWAYAGCLEGRGFDECGEKGFYVLDCADKKIQPTFVNFASRTIHEVPVTLHGTMNYKEVLDAIKQETTAVPQKDLVKVVLQGDLSEDTAIDTAAYEQQLMSSFYFIKIEDKTQIAIDYTKYRNEISLKGEFVRHVEKQDIPVEEKNRIIMVGLKALAGQRI